MPKLKTNRGAKKRFKVTASGKIKCGAAHKRHMLQCKSQKMKRHARSGMYVADADVKSVTKMLRVYS